MKYSFPSKNNGRLKSIEIYEGESIETKCARILQDKEPITDTAPIIYTAKEDGVLPAYNIRTDRFDIAMDAYDKITRASAKKEIVPKPENFKNVPDKTSEGSPSEN
nr:MAG TPA: hypothetical protein [Bacteriophage sp.]